MNTTDLKHYQSSEWHFALDIPKRWNSFPPVSANSPYELIRFASREDGAHLLIILRKPQGPGFGTTNKAGMFELYDRMARSLEILAEPA